MLFPVSDYVSSDDMAFKCDSRTDYVRIALNFHLIPFTVQSYDLSSRICIISPLCSNAPLSSLVNSFLMAEVEDGYTKKNVINSVHSRLKEN